jgi:hypothetical protein
VAGILGGMVDATVIRERVVATDQPPSSATLAAARTVSELGEVGWQDFTPAFRDVLVNRVADEAVLTPVSTPAATLQSTYNQYKSYFFLQICTVTSSAFSAADAAKIAAQKVPNGVLACYNQVQFEAQPKAFQTAVLTLPVGQVAPPIKTSFGYQVVRVVDRALQPYTPDLQRVLSLVITSSQGTGNPVVTGLLSKASVRINPAYGTWTSLQVKAPTIPNSSS